MPVGAVATYLIAVTARTSLATGVSAALVLGGQNTVAPDHPRQAVFVLAAFAASTSRQVLLAGCGAVLGRVLTGDRGRLVTAIVSSAVIAGLAVNQLLRPS